jgi:hypothetical protein
VSLFRRKRTVESLRLEPGDVLVMQSQKPLTQELAHCLVRDLGQVFPDNSIAVLEDGISLRVVKKTDPVIHVQREEPIRDTGQQQRWP